MYFKNIVITFSDLITAETFLDLWVKKIIKSQNKNVLGSSFNKDEI